MPTVMCLAGQEHRLEILSSWPELVVRLDGGRHVVSRAAPAEGREAIDIDGRRFEYHAANDDAQIHLRGAGRTWRVDLPDPRDTGRLGRAAGDEIIAEMPGTLVQVARQPGEDVEAGDVVVTIESMKLQMNLSAPRAGRIARISVEPNQAFEKGATLVVLEPLAQAPATPVQEA